MDEDEEVVAEMLAANPVGLDMQLQAVTATIETETVMVATLVGVGEDGTEVRGVAVVGVIGRHCEAESSQPCPLKVLWRHGQSR